jgi:RNA polymerase sigma factor (sigma-70 family)
LVAALALSCGDRSLAEEFAQEALARAYRDWSKVRDLSNPEAWVHRVAINLSHSWFRKRRLANVATAPDDESSGVAEREAMRSGLMRLPKRQREAIVLRYYADLSVRDTALAMRCAEGTVRALTSQGITALRLILEP